MARTPKKLGQATLNVISSVVTLVTGAALRTQVTELYLSNNGTSARKVFLLAHGVGVNDANRLLPIPLESGEGKILQDIKIVLGPNETLRLYQDSGTDVTATAYGIEEV